MSLVTGITREFIKANVALHEELLDDLDDAANNLPRPAS
jgi:hypothetical protein